MKCAVCSGEINEHMAYTSISEEGHNLYVVVLNGIPYLLKANDTLCDNCRHIVIWYKRE